MIRAMVTVTSNLSGVSAKPGAFSHTIAGMATMHRTVRTSRTGTNIDTTCAAKVRALASPPASSSLANSGTKAVLNAPSAKMRRNRFGSANAV